MKKIYIIYFFIALLSPISIVSPYFVIYGFGKYTEYKIAKIDKENAKYSNQNPELDKMEREKKQHEFRERFMHPQGTQ